MSYLVAAITVMAMLTTANLLLLAAVVRRLRDHQSVIQGLQRLEEPPTLGVQAGSGVPEFDASSSDGELISARDLEGRPTLIFFLSTSCSACRELVPALRRSVEDLSAVGGQAICVICGSGPEAQEYQEALAGATRFIVEPEVGGRVSTAFGADFFPSFALIDNGGTVEDSGLLQDYLDRLEEAPAVRR